MENFVGLINSAFLAGIDSNKNYFMIVAGVCLIIMIIFIFLKFKNKN